MGDEVLARQTDPNTKHLHVHELLLAHAGGSVLLRLIVHAGQQDLLLVVHRHVRIALFLDVCTTLPQRATEGAHSRVCA